MAVVNVDLSEYDMIRESEKNAKRELAELKKELQSLKDNSSCVVKTRVYHDTINVNRLAEQVKSMMKNVLWESPYLCGCTNQVSDAIKNCINSVLQQNVNQRTYFTEDPMQIEVVGFETMRNQVESILREQYEKSWQTKIELADQKLNEYYEKIDSIENVLNQKFNKKLSANEDEIKSLKDELLSKDLEIKELSKSTEVRIAEAQQRVDLAMGELNRLKQNSKQNWFKNIFKKHE